MLNMLFRFITWGRIRKEKEEAKPPAREFEKGKGKPGTLKFQLCVRSEEGPDYKGLLYAALLQGSPSKLLDREFLMIDTKKNR